MSGIAIWGHPSPTVSSDVIVGEMTDRLCHLPFQCRHRSTVGREIAVGMMAPVPRLMSHARREGATEHPVEAWCVGRLFDEGNRDSASAVLSRYSANGSRAVAGINGEFVAAVWDPQSRELWVINDRHSLYPHYWSVGQHGFALAPELKALCAVPGFKATLDTAAVGQFIRYQQLLGERTWLDGVSLLPPGSILRVTFEGGRALAALQPYWDWTALDQVRSITFDAAVHQAISVFEAAVDARIREERQVGVFLSGGIDSRTLVGFVEGKRPITTYSFGTADCRDVLLANRLASRAGTDHHVVLLDQGEWVRQASDLHLSLSEGFHAWQHAHGITAFESARQHEATWLSGWDGGTILGARLSGYDDDALRLAGDEPRLAQTFHEAFCSKFTWPGLTDAEAQALLDTEQGRRVLPVAKESMEHELSATRHYRPDIRGDAFYIRQVDRRSFQMQVVNARGWLDMSCPFFDYGLIDFLYSLPLHIRTNPLFRREILTRRMPHLAAIPCDKDLTIPHTGGAFAVLEQLHRVRRWIHRRILPVFPDPPTLYADYENYLRTTLREWAEDLLLRPRTEIVNFVDPRVVEALWLRHLSGHELWTIGKIAPLITLEALLRDMATWHHTPTNLP